jgi:hypothetical protein
MNIYEQKERITEQLAYVEEILSRTELEKWVITEYTNIKNEYVSKLVELAIAIKNYQSDGTLGKTDWNLIENKPIANYERPKLFKHSSLSLQGDKVFHGFIVCAKPVTPAERKAARRTVRAHTTPRGARWHMGRTIA